MILKCVYHWAEDNLLEVPMTGGSGKYASEPENYFTTSNYGGSEPKLLLKSKQQNSLIYKTSCL